MVIALQHGTLDLDAGQFTPTNGSPESLTDTERKLLRHLAARAGQPVSREELQREVWGYRDGILSRTVFTTVGRVRAKIEQNAADPRHLLTVPGVGYTLVIGRATPAGPETTGLPSPVKLIGRAADLVGIEQLFAGGARLVTLLGPGGIGKTALAAEFARRRPGAVGFVSLEPVGTERAVPAAIAGGLGLTLSGGRDAWGELAGRLGGEAVLCVLDNTEHLPGLPLALPGLLAACPGLSCLVTTRLRLGLRDEHAWTLAPLDAPAALDLALARARTGWDPSGATWRPWSSCAGGSAGARSPSSWRVPGCACSSPPSSWPSWTAPARSSTPSIGTFPPAIAVSKPPSTRPGGFSTLRPVGCWRSSPPSALRSIVRRRWRSPTPT